MARSTDPGQMLYRRSVQRATWLALLLFLLIFLYLRIGFPHELVVGLRSPQGFQGLSTITNKIRGI